MSLFTPDLYRHFAYGFITGALIVGAATIDEWGPNVESPAQATNPLEMPAPSADFQIRPLDLAE